MRSVWGNECRTCSPPREGRERDIESQSKEQNAQFRPFFQTDLLLVQQFGDRRMMAEGYYIITGYLEPVGDVGHKLIRIGVFWRVSCASRLALSLGPSWTHLSRDLPPTADVNAVLPTSGNIEAAA